MKMTGLWDYSKVESSEHNGRYGDRTMYEKGMGWLEEVCAAVEDWGCGTTCARHFLKTASYKGIDGSASKFTDQVADLTKYTSKVEGIFMRGILEHNLEWQKILWNALDSFTKRFVLILFTPWSDGETYNMMADTGILIPDLSFKKSDITDMLKNFKVREESQFTNSQYNVEHIFYVERP